MWQEIHLRTKKHARIPPNNNSIPLVNVYKTWNVSQSDGKGKGVKVSPSEAPAGVDPWSAPGAAFVGAMDIGGEMGWEEMGWAVTRPLHDP